MLRPSLWLQQVAGDAPDAAALVGAARADVAIIGGGYVGLWTAIHLKEQDPGCDVVVLDQDICGGGASGRNGGFVLSWWPKIMTLVSLCGRDEAVRLARASEASIGAIDEFCRRHGVDAQMVRGGWLWAATNAAQDGAWGDVLDACESLGVAPFRRLDPGEVAARTGSAIHRAGVIEASNATVHPGALARGLRRVALGMGVRIYERTRVMSFSRATPSVLRTGGGVVRADVVVIATAGWAAGIRELAQAMVVVSSDIVATEPIPERLAEIGWTDGVAITDARLRVQYYRTTRDGRIVFGKGGGAVAFGGRIGVGFDRAVGRAVEVEREFRVTYPMLGGVRVTHDWSGAVDRTPSALPAIGHLGRRGRILHGVGWSGHGVGPSHLGGRMLASLALGRRDEFSEAGIVDRSMGWFPPEPLRYLGGRVVQGAITRKERAESAGRRPAVVDSLLARLAPNE